jgi:hypothetical protein
MLNDKTEKKNQLKNRQKKLESTRLTCQTRDMGHETEITTKKKTTINYEVQYSINLLKDKIKEKT